MKLKEFLKKQPKQFTPLRVRWLDTHTVIGWRNRNAVLETAADGIVAESVGQFLAMVGKGDQEGLSIVMTRAIKGDDDVSEGLVFPLAVVKDVKVLK